MKNTQTKTILRIVGIITLVAIIGFSIAGCKTDGDDDSGDPNSGQPNTGATLKFPTEFTTRAGTLGDVGEWTSTTLGGVFFSNSSGYMSTNGGQQMYNITSISSKTIKVKVRDASTSNSTGDEITLCTDYTRTETGRAGTLTLTGASGVFENIGVLTAAK
jgi:hypothetical protein